MNKRTCILVGGIIWMLMENGRWQRMEKQDFDAALLRIESLSRSRKYKMHLWRESVPLHAHTALFNRMAGIRRMKWGIWD